nr:MAG TPA: ParB protein [Caudoviricetes sp.]
METRTTLSVGDLHPYRGNPRNGDVALIKASLLEHGQYRPAVVNDTDGGYTVLAGNHLVHAMRELNEEHPNEGWDVVWVHIVHLDEQQARRLALTDNRASDLATYDHAALLAELEALDVFDGTGWAEADLEALEALTADAEPEPEGDAPDEFPYPGMATVTLHLLPPLHEQWQDFTRGFDSPEEALEHLLDHGGKA